MSSPSSFPALLSSAPAKLILFGEHAVVYGRPAVAASLGLRGRVRFLPDDQHGAVTFPEQKVSFEWKKDLLAKELLARRPPHLGSASKLDQHFLSSVRAFVETHCGQPAPVGVSQTSLVCFLYLYCAACPADQCDAVGLRAEAASDVPMGAGLGSSAALAVALSAGLLRACSDSSSTSSEDVVERVAHFSEQIVHGQSASGLDGFVSCRGGVVSFAASGGRRGRMAHSPALKVLLINTCVARRTADQVEKVAEKMRSPLAEVTRSVLDVIGKISEGALKSLQSLADSDFSQYERLDELVYCNQKQLECLEVSHPSLDSAVSICSEHQLKAKLTGAGGGGFAFCFLPPRIDSNRVKSLRDRLKTEGFVSWETLLDDCGLAVEVIDETSSV